MAKQWRVASYREIPSNRELDGVTGAEMIRALRERDPAAAERWTRLAVEYPDSDRVAHAVRRFFGISSFGVNVFEASVASPLVIPHDETQYGHEELYLVVAGRARFVCDGDEVDLREGAFLYVAPEVHREAVALETPTVLLALGGVPGEPYSPPRWSPDWRPQPSG